MKPCPECGEMMRLAMGRWVHVTPGSCHTVTLQATAEELRQHARPALRTHGQQVAGWHERGRFYYLSTDRLKNQRRPATNEGGIRPIAAE